MNKIDFSKIKVLMQSQIVDRPNRSSSGTLSGHAAGEPFEKKVYEKLKETYQGKIFKQYEFLNDLYLKYPEHISVEQKKELFESPTVLFLLTRGDKATAEWSPTNVFVEKQNDTADIIYYVKGYYNLIAVKTRNIAKNAQPPNIISAYKLAKACALMIDNNDYGNVEIDYIEIDWEEDGAYLKCKNVHYGNLFKANPDTLYINWAAGMQIQFHVRDLNQDWTGSIKEWAKEYIRVFVKSAEERCTKMRENYIIPFLKYID